jgi:hypothetical protein
MANNCADGTYTLEYTDNSKNPIIVNKKTLVQDIVDITLLGKSRLEYGEVFDENILHILENFASPENPGNPGTPDYTQIYSNLLQQPTQGQIWYNTTQERYFFYDLGNWNALSSMTDIGGNSGIIMSGQMLPLPVSPITGYQFKYEECSWVVAPFGFSTEINYMVCYADTTGLVRSEYVNKASGNQIEAYATYQIIGIRNNKNLGTIEPILPTPLPNLTPSATPPTPSGVQVTPSYTPAITPSVTPSTHAIAPLKAVLYITPSKGFPQNTATEFLSPCTTTGTSDGACLYTLGVVVQGFSGGTPPYTVDFTNVNFSRNITNTTKGTMIPSNVIKTYSGASGANTYPVRTGVLSTTSTAIGGTLTEEKSLALNPTSASLGCDTGSLSLGLIAGSYVVVTDSGNQTLTLYTPSGINGNVYGTTYTTPQQAYADSWLSTPIANCKSGSVLDGGGNAPIKNPNLQADAACVAITSFFPDGTIAADLQEGVELNTSDPYDFFNGKLSTVTYSETKTKPCVKIVTETGASLVCSTTAPIPSLHNGYKLAPTLMGEMVPVMRHNITKWEKIVSVVCVGDLEVRHITVGDRCFWAGETADAFILHHNKS